MLRCCLGAYGRPNHAWMPSLGAGLIRLSQPLGHVLERAGGGPAQVEVVSLVLVTLGGGR